METKKIPSLKYGQLLGPHFLAGGFQISNYATKGLSDLML